MKLYKHKSHDMYIEAQIIKNKRKLKNIWVKEEEISLLHDNIRKNIIKPSFGICHGVRNGWEVQKLIELIKINIIGTDISPTATEFKNVIKWDFHDIKSNWKNNVDFIYSNSFDHSYDPDMCLDKWMQCIKKNKGVCYIHWMKSNFNKAGPADCFAASRKEYRKMFNKKYEVVDEFFRYKTRVIFAIKHKHG